MPLPPSLATGLPPDSAKMAWTSASDNQFVRPLDSLEAFYSATAAIGTPLGQEHLALKFGIKIGHNLPDAGGALRQAWIASRYQHPKIAARSDGERLIYSVPDTSALDAWVEETFVTKPGVTARELFSQLTRPAAQMLLYYLPDSSEIVFFTSHWRLDGIGSMMFVSDFLSHLVAPDLSTRAFDWGKEVSNLPPGLDTALDLPATIPEDQDSAQNQSLMQFGAHLPSINILPVGSTSVPSSTTEREELKLPSEFSSAIVAGCKKHDISVTSAMHAALIAATLALQDPASPAKNYASWSAFSLRQSLPEPLQNSTYAVNGAHTGVPLTLVPSGSFLTDASELSGFYRSRLTSDEVKGRQVFHNKLKYQLSQPLPEGFPIPADPALNSIGVIDKYVKETYEAVDHRVGVENFWLGNTVCTPNVWIHLWQFHGQITLSALHNRGLYQQENIHALLQKVVEILHKEFGIEQK